MNDDYLWDRSGDPDVEVQELEDVLGTLRYQPRPLVLPAELPKASNRYVPLLAIAAAVALIALGLGIWLRIQRQRIAPPEQIVKQNKSESAVPIPSPEPSRAPDKKELALADGPQRRRLPSNNNRLAGNPTRGRAAPHRDEMTAAERAQGEAAKDQLMLALRVVSTKLNLAQRKAVPATGNTRNQHKVG